MGFEGDVEDEYRLRDVIEAQLAEFDTPTRRRLAERILDALDLTKLGTADNVYGIGCLTE